MLGFHVFPVRFQNQELFFMFFKCFQAYTTRIIFVSVFVCGEEKEIKQLKLILKKGSFVPLLFPLLLVNKLCLKSECVN